MASYPHTSDFQHSASMPAENENDFNFPLYIQAEPTDSRQTLLQQSLTTGYPYLFTDFGNEFESPGFTPGEGRPPPSTITENDPNITVSD